MRVYRKFNVFVACPSDVADEKQSLARVIERLNHGPANDAGVVLELSDWRQVVPSMGIPEDVIIAQKPINTWDLFIGILWLRFGQPTGNTNPNTGMAYESGTEEEFCLAHRSWQQHQRPRIMIYRCTRPPSDMTQFDRTQYEKVDQFFESFEATGGTHPGLYRCFRDTNEFSEFVFDDISAALRMIVPAFASRDVPRSNVAVFGLAISGYVTRSPNQLERSILEALQSLRFEGVKCSVAGNWQGSFRLDAVPDPILRAWVAIRPEELSAAMDRLRLLGYVESRRGTVSLPFASYKTTEGTQQRQMVMRDLIVEKPDGRHIAVSHIVDAHTETVIALAGTFAAGEFKIDDPCPFLFDVRPKGQMICHVLTSPGLHRLESISLPTGD